MKKMLYLSLLFALLPIQSAFSHAFHYELRVASALQFNEDEQLNAVKISWLYDGDVSEIMLQDQKDLKMLGDKTIKDLGLLAYFTQIKINGEVVAFNAVENSKLEKTNNGEYDELRLHLTLPLKTAVSLKDIHTINFYHEDPSAAAILYYENATDITLGFLQKRCLQSVKEKSEFKEGEFPQIVTINCKT